MADSVIFQTLDDEIILLNTAEQGYFGLDAVGATMWNALMECGDLATAAEKVSTHYQADPATVKQDMQELVDELLARGLLKPQSQSARSSSTSPS
jgi:Coenzyme PQQ synthesis protein D (PqqD)